MRAECKVMHTSVMAKIADDEMAASQMMTHEMTSKHKACMKMTPEMTAEMRTKHETSKAGHIKDIRRMVAYPMTQPDADHEGKKP